MKYGFIYIWYDTKNKRFYLGRHWGTIDDGYICSSNSMRDAYRRRPNDFKRRILSIRSTKEDMIIEEQRWLNLISKEELGKKYYNKTRRANMPCGHKENWTEERRQKQKEKMLGNTHTKNKKYGSYSEERRKNISKSMLGKNKGKMPWNKGIPQTDEMKAKNRESHLGKKHTEETKQKMRDRMIGNNYAKKQGEENDIHIHK